MTQVLNQKFIEEFKFVKAKVIEMDKELQRLREDFADTHLSKSELRSFAKALEEEKLGKTVSLNVLKKRLRF